MYVTKTSINFSQAQTLVYVGMLLYNLAESPSKWPCRDSVLQVAKTHFSPFLLFLVHASLFWQSSYYVAVRVARQWASVESLVKLTQAASRRTFGDSSSKELSVEGKMLRFGFTSKQKKNGKVSVFSFLFTVPCYLCSYCVFWKAGQKLQINCGNVTMRPCFCFCFSNWRYYWSFVLTFEWNLTGTASWPTSPSSSSLALGSCWFMLRLLRPEHPDGLRLPLQSDSWSHRWQQGEGKIFCLIRFICIQLTSLSLSFCQMPPSRPADQWLDGPVDLLHSSQFDLICFDLNAPVGFSKYARSVRQQPFLFICFRKPMFRKCVHHLRWRQHLIWKGSD